MEARRLLIDNDAFLLLAGSDLLPEAITLLGFTVDEARRLTALEYMLRKPARSLSQYPADTLNRALEACAIIAPIEEAPSAEVLAAFEDVRDIDAGEAALYGLAAAHDLYVVASNDKRAMKALAAGPTFGDILGQLRGKVVCMELLLKLLLEQHGPEFVLARFQSLLAKDVRIFTILSPATTGRPDDCQAAATSFLQALDRDLGCGLLRMP